MMAKRPGERRLVSTAVSAAQAVAEARTGAGSSGCCRCWVIARSDWALLRLPADLAGERLSATHARPSRAW
jgi:hypothetical protein